VGFILHYCLVALAFVLGYRLLVLLGRRASRRLD